MDLLAAEHALHDAQRAGDVQELDRLLHPRCVGYGPDGSVFSKDDDLQAHRSGQLRITRLETRSLDVREDGPTGVTRLVADVDAVQGGSVVSSRLRYTRLWVRSADGWSVLAATLTAGDEPG